MLRFTLFGFPVTIHWMFWLIMLVFGAMIGGDNLRVAMIWVVAATLSILIHELGHTFTMRHYGARAQILLYGMGGLAMPDRSFNRRQQIMVSLAGPVVEIIVGFAVLQLAKSLGVTNPYIMIFVKMFFWVSVVWGLLNLLPIYPMDGGQVLFQALGPSHARTTFAIGIVFAAITAVVMFMLFKAILAPLFFGMMAFENYKRMRGEHVPSFFSPIR